MGWYSLFGSYGLVEPDIQVLVLLVLLLRFLMLVGGSRMEIWSWIRRLIFLAVVEHRLIPARVRGEWARLRKKGLATVWAPASQDTSHVGHDGVGVVSLRGAPLSLPTFATAQFKRFF